ncbi:MAG: ribosomal L7Ae/L30e/S12e/Gadd45 family protein [Candidatus Nanoarchaeia archaeon]|nr:ribosomal L7Ae/L30e/S12e/Gadd45 family protein [Candidatus Nanoarchaeia archaeon]
MADNIDKVLTIVETARTTGKIKKGTNEVTKAVERDKAKLVVVALDTNPKEIIMHLGPLCKEKGIPYFEVPSRKELGAATGIEVPTAAIAVVEAGESVQLIKKLKDNQ